MQSRAGRIGVVVAAIVVVVALFLVLREDDGGEGPATPTRAQTTAAPGDEPKPKPESEVVKEEIEVQGGQPVGGVREIAVPAGEEAEIVVTSPDTAEHVHLHGYDIFADLAPGQPAKIRFKATIEGVFEMELEDSVTPIADVTVKPG